MITIPLTKGYVAVVDDEDADLARLKWHAHEQKDANGRVCTVYARSHGVDAQGRRTTVLLHRVVMDLADGVHVDHVDRDGLNNRRSNLRAASPTLNGRNRGIRTDSLSRMKGVSWGARHKAWQARITVGGKTQFLGRFKSRDEAGRAYDAAAVRLFGPFACLNFPPDLRVALSNV